MIRDSRGILYVGTYNGLARWDSNNNKFTKVKAGIDNPNLKNLFVNCLLESPDNSSIYIGSEGTLYEYTPVNDAWKKIAALENNNIKSMAKGHNDHILIGTDNGVFVGIKTPYVIIVMIQGKNLVCQITRYGVFLPTETIISGQDMRGAFQ